MGLNRLPILPSSKPERIPHKCVPIAGEFGRYTVASASAAKAGKEEAYIVDVLAEEQTETHGLVTGTCGCKGWSVRKTCSHVVDAKEEHRKLALELIDRAAANMGFTKIED